MCFKSRFKYVTHEIVLGLFNERKVIISFNICRLWSLFISSICLLIIGSTYHYTDFKKRLKKGFSHFHHYISAHGVPSSLNPPSPSFRLNAILPSSSRLSAIISMIYPPMGMHPSSSEVPCMCFNSFYGNYAF